MTQNSESAASAAERAIERVLVAYARGIDRCDEAILKDCYWPDSTDDHGTFKGNGHDFSAWVVVFLAKAFSATQHTLSNTRIDLQLERAAAHVESYVVARHVTRAEPAQLVEAGGRYLDRFSLRDGQWRIARRVVVIDWSRVSVIEAGFPADAFVSGQRAPEDPSYDIENI